MRLRQRRTLDELPVRIFSRPGPAHTDFRLELEIDLTDRTSEEKGADS